MMASEIYDRVEIESVIGAFAVGLDSLLSVFPVRLDPAELAAVFDYFAPDGVLQSPFARTEGREAIREAWARVATLEPTENSPKYCRHHLTSFEIVLTGPTTAEALVYMQALTERGLDHWGYNEYRMVKLADGWKFAENVVTVQDWVTGGFYDGLPHSANKQASA
jgi:ketosteroid isomerase-like protein